MVIQPSTDKRIWNPSGGLARKGEYESFTSISKYLSCPVNHYKYYVAYGREGVTPAGLLGRAAHETIASVLVEKLLRNVTLSLDAIEQTFRVKWGVELFLAKNQPGGISWKGSSTPMELEQTGVSLLRHWGRDILPDVDVVAVEKSFSVKLKDVKQFLFGRLDIVVPNGFCDHKTSSQDYDKDDDKFRLQMGTYYLGYLDHYKGWPTQVCLTWLKTTGDLEATILSYSLSKDDVQEIINKTLKPTMRNIYKSFETKVWECRCGKHKNVTPETVAQDKIDAAKAELEKERVLNPERKGIPYPIPEKVEVEKVNPDTIPF